MIIYASKYGSVREYVGWIGQKGNEAATGRHSGSSDPFTAYDVGREKKVAADALRSADDGEPVCIISPVYAGQLHGRVKTFIGEEIDLLRKHPVAIALTSLYEGEQAKEELLNVFPSSIVAHASRQFLIGGRIRPSELPFFVRIIIKKITGTSEEIDTLDREAVGDIAAWLRDPGV